MRDSQPRRNLAPDKAKATSGGTHTMRAFGLLLALAGLTAVATSAHAADSASPNDRPELRSVRAEIKAKQYPAALAELKVLVTRYQDPDVYSLLGFSLRKTGDRPQAMTYYLKALEMNPSHKGALEYQGELFVELGQVDKAKENLAKLKRICMFGCEEREDLQEAIEHAPKGS
jgi:tetratricopeptide (TPR) repeat protein